MKQKPQGGFVTASDSNRYRASSAETGTRRQRNSIRDLLTPGLAFAASLLLAACGGGEDSGSTDSSRTARVFAAAVSETVLTPVAASASSQERADLSAAAAIDHNAGTRWGSGFSDDQFLTLDFGKSVAINWVHIEWENAHAAQYLLQVSDDNANWTTIKSVDNSQGGIEDWSGLAGQGRYLRMKGIKRSSQYGYSIFEIQAFSGTPVDSASSSTSTTSSGTTSGTVDLSKPGVLIKPVAATSSAVENGGLSATQAIDGNLTTRWASAFEDGAWIQFDFGAEDAGRLHETDLGKRVRQGVCVARIR